MEFVYVRDFSLKKEFYDGTGGTPAPPFAFD